MDTKIEQLIKKNEFGCFAFKPDRSFYDSVKINQKRWGQIAKGKADPKLSELRAIATYFKVELSELI